MSHSPKAVFLSYASQDVDAARRVCDALRKTGVEVWFDQSELRGGDAWDASIRRQIKDCALFVPIISANTQLRNEGYFRLEWKLAVDRSHLMADDQAFLLPVVIDATLDSTARVPERFREVHWTRLPAGGSANTFAEHISRLLVDGVLQPLQTARPPGFPRHARSDIVAPTSAAVSLEPPSIAVLPFVNRSNDVDDEYFSDGLADELLNVLAKIRGLRVAARTSSFSFKGKPTTIAEVGRALSVTTVLEGSVRKSGNRMRISVQLVKVADGFHLWSETYDRTLEDIFAVQDDIAQSVVTKLRTTLLGETSDAGMAHQATAQVAAAVRGRTSNPEAYRLYLLARHCIDRYSRDDIKKGIDYVKQALALDPAFALGWVELGRAYVTEAVQGWASVSQGFAKGREAVTRALALEPDLAEGHTQIAWIQSMCDWDWRAAEASCRRALELAPGSTAVLHRVSVVTLNLGRVDEAIALSRQAVDQDPLNATAIYGLGYRLYAAGLPAEAEAAYRRALKLAPQRADTHGFLSLVLLEQGRDEDALNEALSETEEWCRLWALAVIHHAADRLDASEAALQELIAKHSGGAAFQIALAYAARGEATNTFVWLERAYDQRDTGLPEISWHPLLRPLYSDPRWGAFVQKMGFAN